ncbi:hypothetical protein E2320_001892, partial [Naja naja]
MLIIRMSTHAQPEPFDPKKHDWVSYMGKFRMFLEANSLQDTTEQRKRALFLGYCGNRLYKTARTLAAPKDVETMEWKELQKMLEERYAPAASEQKPGETINDYLTNLRDIAAGCKFENVEIALRIVVGMRDLRLQRKLTTKKSISLKEVIEEARAAEISEKPAAKIEKSDSVHSAWGTTSKYQGEGEIGELSKEEEKEIHRGPKDRARDRYGVQAVKGTIPGRFANSGIQSAIEAREGGILLKHAEQICQHIPVRDKQGSLIIHVAHNKGDSRDLLIQIT